MAMALAGASASRRQFKLGQNSDINVTPFVDVMLVLLIIFMVTAPLATTAIKVDLSPLRVTNSSEPPQPVTISITEDGRIFASGPQGDQSVTLDGLAGGIARVLGAAPSGRQEILVRADQRVRYGAFMAVMNRLQTDGFYRVALVGEEVKSYSAFRESGIAFATRTRSDVLNLSTIQRSGGSA
jgi:biopolymer transport protein ExbD